MILVPHNNLKVPTGVVVGLNKGRIALNLTVPEFTFAEPRRFTLLYIAFRIK